MKSGKLIQLSTFQTSKGPVKNVRHSQSLVVKKLTWGQFHSHDLILFTIRPRRISARST